MNNQVNITSFDQFKRYINTTNDKVVFGENKPQNKGPFIDKIKNLFKSRMDEAKKVEIESKVINFLEEGIRKKLNKDTAQFDRFLPRILRNCKVNEHQLTNVKNVRKVLNAINHLELAGQAPQFDDFLPKMVSGENARNLIKFLFSDQPLSMKLVNFEVVKALLVSKNKELLTEVLSGLHDYLSKLSVDLNRPEFAGPHEQKLGEILIGNILALYPFFEPEDGAKVAIPQKMDTEWVLMPYTVNLLQMTPSWKGDPYYACGFSPDNKEGQPYLSFMGTPPPTTRGVAHAEFTDFIPGKSVGESVYKEGKATIEKWVENIAGETKKRVDVYGQSLGGSLSLILAANLPLQVGKIFAYNPPSLWKALFNQYQTQVTPLEKNQKPEINIFCQENDPIYSLGAGWDPDWNVYQVLPEKAPNLYEAHIRAFSSHKVVVIKMTPKEIKKHNASLSRRIYNVGMEILRVPLFIVKGASLQIQIIKHNASRAIQKIHNKAQLLLFGGIRREPAAN